MAEKMAALDVVHRRLRDAGLGSLTLELHSDKANKRALLEELRSTKELAGCIPRSDATVITRLKEAQNQLNSHADAMHRVHEPCGMTPYQLIGHLVRIGDGPGLPGFPLAAPESWTPLDFEKRVDVCSELTDRFGSIGHPVEHPWYGVRREALDPGEIDHLRRSVADLRSNFERIIVVAQEASARLGAEQPQVFSDLVHLLKVVRAISSVPECDRKAFADPIWQQPGRVAEVVETGVKLKALRETVDASFTESVWMSSLAECRSVLAAKGASLFRIFSGDYRSQLALLKSYLKQPLPKELPARLALVDDVLSALETQRNFNELKTAGIAAFGAQWNGENSDWDRAGTVLDWRRANETCLTPHVLAYLASATDLPRQAEIAREMSELLTRFIKGWATCTAFSTLISNNHLEPTASCLPISEPFPDGWGGGDSSIEAVTKWAAFYDAGQHPHLAFRASSRAYFVANLVRRPWSRLWNDHTSKHFVRNSLRGSLTSSVSTANCIPVWWNRSVD